MTYLARYISLIIFLVAMGWFMSVPIVHWGADMTYAQSVDENHTFNEQELKDFLNLWHKAVSGYVKNYMPSASMDENSLSRGIFSRWLKLHNWNKNRFFYDEQRLRDLIGCAEIQNNMDSNIEIQQKTSTNLSDLLNMQKKQLALCHFDQKEIELVKNYLPDIILLMPDLYNNVISKKAQRSLP